MHIHRRVSSAMVLLLLVGCGGGSDSTDPDAGVHSDQGTVIGDSGSSHSDQGTPPISDSGSEPLDQTITFDVPELPDSCPCPLDSYCDLASNTCVLGCKNNDHCSEGKYCELASELCKPGCRSEANCSDDGNPCTDLFCHNGQCQHPPNSAPCPDDGNPCTDDMCGNGTCQHPPGNSGSLCGASLDCSSFRCSNGSCTETFEPPGTACTDDGDGCTEDTCDGAGTCAHETSADGTDCPNTWGGWGAKCFSGSCTPLRYRCCGSSTLYYLTSAGDTDTWDGTTSCGCSGQTMKWSGWYSGYFLEHDEYCSSCESDGSYCSDCYDTMP